MPFNLLRSASGSLSGASIADTLRTTPQERRDQEERRSVSLSRERIRLKIAQPGDAENAARR